MLFKNSLIFFVLLFIHKGGMASPDGVFQRSGNPAVDTVYMVAWAPSAELAGETTALERPSPLLNVLRHKQKKNKKIVATLLAFPFPFGIVGLHRIYLGCSPYVPVAYIGSLGGVFGILPFIDFCVLLLDKDIDRYINNKKIFMWIN